MVNYSSVIQTGCSLLAIIFIGFVIFKFGIVPSSHIISLNKFLLKTCYLPLVAKTIASSNIKQIDFMPFLLGALTVTVFGILLSVVFLFPLKDKFKFYLSSFVSTSFVNYLIVGLPIFESIWDPSQEVMLPILNLSNDIYVCVIYLILSNIYLIIQKNKVHKQLEDGKEEHFNLKTIASILIRIITNPIIIGNILGFIWSGAGFGKCPFLWDLMTNLSKCVTCCSMLCVGGFISQHSVLACHWLHFLGCIFLRHILFPTIMTILCYIFHISNTLARQCIIMSIMPTATVSFILACDFNISPGVPSTLILWTCILCVPFTIIWNIVLDELHLFIE